MPRMRSAAGVYDESAFYPWIKVFCVPLLRPVAIRCLSSIIRNFFLRQYRAVLLPGRIPISKADHPLDRKIPFVPSWITIYIDFGSYWVRIMTFFLRGYGRRTFAAVRDFIVSMGDMYTFVGKLYRQNLSTTDRPFYIATPRFLVIHLLDPHLLCIPSLHVMVVILTYTTFAAILRSLGDEDKCRAQIEEMKQGALAITQSVLFVKQHSVNCIPTALYAMTSYNAKLFPPGEAESFVNRLFEKAPPASSLTGRLPSNYKVRPWAAPGTKLPPEDIAEIKAYIISQYRRFLAEGKNASSWEEPLLHFMSKMPRK